MTLITPDCGKLYSRQLQIRGLCLLLMHVTQVYYLLCHVTCHLYDRSSRYHYHSTICNKISARFDPDSEIEGSVSWMGSINVCFHCSDFLWYENRVMNNNNQMSDRYESTISKVVSGVFHQHSAKLKAAVELRNGQTNGFSSTMQIMQINGPNFVYLQENIFLAGTQSLGHFMICIVLV